MTKTVDARGLSCPQPLVLTMKALAEADEVITIVDSAAAKENVTRFGKSQGCAVSSEQKEEGIYLTLKKAKAESPKVATGIVLFVGSDVVGRGEDQQLGALLMEKFLHTVGGLAQKPETILLMNTGVKLIAEDSLAIGEMQQLEALGIEILACGTCLQRFQLTGKIKAGKISDMYTIADTMFKAEKVITL
ncbi:MAG: sulfurtransferase-like selenium metabolism protein YedF [Dehalococcoidales bacterium]|nr:sulfurtransferase-like selenium metabolism protein YedF [Dehalococcoidales bacterium]